MRIATARPRIGFLVRTLSDDYQAAVVEGARAAALARDMSFLCFAGGELGLASEKQRTHIFELVSRENVDALAIMVWAIGNRVGVDELGRFCARFKGLPMCTVAGPLPGIPSVEVDNREGLHAALRHLIEVHGRRRIAFIRGPEKNEEAQERYQVYVDSLAANGIALDSRLVAEGDFTFQGGVAAMRVFLEERKLGADSIDAIVGADDATALGALSVLREHQIDVPGQIALIGFDDLEEARYSSPSLTTVRQPFREQGEAAVRTLWQMLQGSAHDDRLVLPTTTVFRKSCGCVAGAARDLGRMPATVAGFEGELLKRRDLIGAELARTARGAFVGMTGWENVLIGSFADQLRTGSDRFSKAFEDLLETLTTTSVDIAAAHDVLTTLRGQMLPCIGRDWALRAQAEDLLHDARLAAGSAAERIQAERRVKAERSAQALSVTGRRLLSVSSLDELKVALGESLPQLGIASCYLSLFETSSLPGGRARLLLAHDEPARRTNSPQLFPSQSLAPAECLDLGRPRAFVVISIYFGDEELGILVTSFDRIPFYVYDALAELLGAAVSKASSSAKAAPK